MSATLSGTIYNWPHTGDAINGYLWMIPDGFTNGLPIDVTNGVVKPTQLKPGKWSMELCFGVNTDSFMVTLAEGVNPIEAILAARNSEPVMSYIKGDPGHSPVIRWEGTKLVIDGKAGPNLRGEDGVSPDVSWNGTSLVVDGVAVDLKGEKGERGDFPFVVLTNPDADTVTTPGFYNVSSASSSVNLPEKVVGHLYVSGTNAYLIQQYTVWNNNSPLGRTWIRQRNSTGTAWTRWVNTSWASPLSLQSGADFNTLIDGGSYVAQSGSIANKPTTGLGVLEVMRFSDTTIVQRFTPFNMSTPQIYLRSLSGTTWQVWESVSWWAGFITRYVDFNDLLTPHSYNAQYIDHPNMPVERAGTLTVTGGGSVVVQNYAPSVGDPTVYRRSKGQSGWSRWEPLTNTVYRPASGTWLPTATPKNPSTIAQAMSNDRTTLFNGSNSFGTMRSSVDGDTWTDVYSFPNNFLWCRQLSNGEMLVSLGKDPEPRSLWLSTGFGGDSVTWAKVLDAVAPYAYFATGWSLSIHENIVLIAEYGTKTPTWNGQPVTDFASRVWLSVDYGKTWRIVFNLKTYLTGRGRASTDDQHLHGVCWDPYWDRIWVTFGDATNGVVYSDDLGKTWNTANWNGVPNGGWQAVGIVALPNRVLLASDGYPNGIWSIDRSQGKKSSGTYDIKTAYQIPGSSSTDLQYLCHSINRVPQIGGDIWLFGFGAETASVPSCIVATRNGYNFDLIWMDSAPTPAGFGIRTITGPTLSGELIVGSNDQRVANNWSEFRGQAPIY